MDDQIEQVLSEVRNIQYPTNLNEEQTVVLEEEETVSIPQGNYTVPIENYTQLQ